MTKPRIAIVSMAIRFAGASTPEEFWRLLQAGVDASGVAPMSRWSRPSSEVVAPTALGREGRVPSARGYFLKDLTALDGRGLDAIFSLTQNVALEAFNGARQMARRRRRTGMILGNIVLPTHATSALAWRAVGGAFLDNEAKAASLRLPDYSGSVPFIAPENHEAAALPAILAGAALDLGGRIMTLDAACASTLYALSLAMRELISGRADAMIAGGVSLPDPLYTQMGFAQLRALSVQGKSYPFDERANGLVVGEGAGMFVLKRLDDALADDDNVLGIIAGSGLSNDVGGGLMAPSSEGQLRAMRASYLDAGWSPDAVDMVECHATGTPLGDQVEIESLKRLWQEAGRQRRLPNSAVTVLGSVKANVGHLLTAAGASSLGKVLLSMRAGVLPPTANFKQAAARLELPGSPFAILSTARAWQRRSAATPRRAAVSGFGFGGINAHLLIEEYLPGDGALSATSPAVAAAPRRIAIIGTGKHGSLSPEHAEALEVPIGLFKIPPSELAELSPQQLMTLLAAADAAREAKLDRSPKPRGGVVIAIGLDGATNLHSCRWQLAGVAAGAELETLRSGFGAELTADRVMGSLGGIVASRVAREYGFGAFGFTVSAMAASVARALEFAAAAIRDGVADVVLVGAVHQGQDALNAAIAATCGKKPGGNAAGAIVLKDYAEAVRDGDGIIAEFGVYTEIGANPSTSSLAAPAALGTRDDTLVAPLFNLIAAARAVCDKVTLAGDYWLRNRSEGPRSLNIETSGVAFAVKESDDEATRVPISAGAALQRQALFLFAAPNEAGLTSQVEKLLTRLGDLAPNLWHEAAVATWREQASALAAGTRKHLRLAVAGDFDLWQCRGGVPDPSRALQDLSQILARALALPWGRIPTSVTDPATGLFATKSAAAGNAGDLAFVYPGTGSHYRHLGRELARAFPAVLDAQDRTQASLKAQWAPQVLWSDAARAPTVTEVMAAQCAFAALATDVLAAAGVKPEAAIGYSLGESAALIALGAWTDRDGVFRRLEESPLFHLRLAGEFQSVRRVFQLAPSAPCTWVNHLVRQPKDKVHAALAGIGRVYLNNVNSPMECVIGGEKSAVEKVLARLAAPLMPLPAVPALHCPIVRDVEAEFVALHSAPLTAPPAIRFYSGAAGTAIDPLTSASAAQAILAHALHGVDFPATIGRAYADGVRVFVDIGPGVTMARLIREILGDRPHVVESLAPRAERELCGTYRVLATLFASGRALNVYHEIFGATSRDIPTTAGVRKTLQVRRAPRRCLPIPVERSLQRDEKMAAPPTDLSSSLVRDLAESMAESALARGAAHASFMRLTQENVRRLLQTLQSTRDLNAEPASRPSWDLTQRAPFTQEKPWLDFAACQTLATGRLGDVLGAEFATVDALPLRVRLPAGPLLLCHRIMSVDAVPKSMASGTLVTEHDIHADAWYLDGGRIPTCVAVEAGQADLFLSAYLGADFATKGRAVYRLLDAVVTFHDRLPLPRQTIRYEIKIHKFFRQGETILFRFGFVATVAGKTLITMEDGIAGFFSPQELAAGKGIVGTALDLTARDGRVTGGFASLAPFPLLGTGACESYDDAAVEALRSGDYAGCFGAAFAGLRLGTPKRLPGGMLKLVHRILALDPQGGRFGLGQIVGEADINPGDWFLECHFVDDQVMPGTLMYECCNHTLRIFLMRLGWVADEAALNSEPVPGLASRLKCRGQVLATSQRVEYRIDVKEIGYAPDAYAVANALMLVDGKPIVEITDLSIRHPGFGQNEAEAVWRHVNHAKDTRTPGQTPPKPPIFAYDRILAFASGKPSAAFGEPYRIFDGDPAAGSRRKIARLPRPPFQFLDRITDVQATAWQMQAGGKIQAQYDVPPDAWYFAAAGSSPTLPFAVLLEIALQPCGWFSAYMGSALTSPDDLSYRNLGGTGVLKRRVTPASGVLTTTVHSTKVAQSGGMIIQEFSFAVEDQDGVVYEGETTFGFFSQAALRSQIGLRGVTAPVELSAPKIADYPERDRLPRSPLLMIDELAGFGLKNGRHGLGRLHGRKRVDPAEWFFDAHFYEDPVMPGSLGIEAFLQLLMLAADELWPQGTGLAAVAVSYPHKWTYRGQVVPSNAKTDVVLDLTAVDLEARVVTAAGWLFVDGKPIYQLEGFTVQSL